jgi:NAD(P)-dependent dehydrogenase (short-subunit alcohol dehydrogenase family)
MSKSLFIIGMGPGIGAATAKRFAREGWTIVLGSRNPSSFADFVASLETSGTTVHSLQLDATDPSAVRSAVAEAERLTGGLTAIHFNAARVRAQDIFSMTDAEIEDDLAVNIAAGLFTIRAAAETFAARGGTILVTGGGLAVSPHASYASLGVGKAALRNVVQGLAPDLAERNIHIKTATVSTLVSPGSSEAAGVADIFWSLATDPNSGWEAVYPAA